MISFKQQGDFSKIGKYLAEVQNTIKTVELERFGKAGVAALSSATPVESGKTSSSWSYKIERTEHSAKISFHNSNIQNGVNIAILLQYGHATRNGRWVEGRDYINPAIQPIFDEIVKSAWKEVTKK